MCTVLGAIGFHMDQTEKNRLKAAENMDRIMKREVRIIAKKPVGNFVKIGSMNAPFNPDMHSCHIHDVDTESYCVGDVLACQNPDCGKEWILGWFLSSNPLNNIPDSYSLRDKKKWISMQEYERNPGEYVYSK